VRFIGIFSLFLMAFALAGACGGTSLSPAPEPNGAAGSNTAACPASMPAAGFGCGMTGTACRYPTVTNGCERFAVCDSNRLWVSTETATCVGAGGTNGSTPSVPDAGLAPLDSGVTATPSDAGAGGAGGGANSDSGAGGESGDGATCAAAQAGEQVWWNTLIGYATTCAFDGDCQYVTLENPCRARCAIPMNADRVSAIAGFEQNYAAQNCTACEQITATCPNHAPPAVFCDRGTCQYVTPWQ
jgi:hypothetical protein